MAVLSVRVLGGAALAFSLVVLVSCAAARVQPSDPGLPTWAGHLTCSGLTTPECDASARVVIAALADATASLAPAVGIEIGPGPACPRDLVPGAAQDCVFALLPEQDLLGHTIVDFGPAEPKGYANIRIGSDGSVTADPISLATPVVP